jgi:FixJ family two-component response regulator
MEKTVPTVFVVDDDVSVQRALARLIRSHGMQVKTFASAREFLGCQRPDGLACLILNVRLTGEDGLRRGARPSSSSPAMGQSPCVSGP